MADPQNDQEKAELEKLNKELAEDRAKLEELNHFKSHLLALTSHQMKTPLGIIRGYTALLREGFYGTMDERAKEVVGKIEFAAEDLVNLVDNVMDLRKLEEGKVEYHMEDVDFIKLARQASEELGHMATSKGLNLSFEAPSGEIIVRGDEQKLRHVIQNLVDNAVKYTEKGFVHVKVEEKEGNAVLSVADSGIGIAEGVRPLLFEEFVRDERVKQEIRGSGLGLHVAKLFTEAHQGKVWVESEGEGKGSVFYLSVPVRK
jgi:signal transduction histidine kinase